MQVPSYRLFKEKISEIEGKLNALGTASRKNYTDVVQKGNSNLVTSGAVDTFIKNNL